MDRETLLAAIAADSEPIGNWIVYADWLADRGDPRGELIHLELAIEAGSTDDAVLDRHHILMSDKRVFMSPRLAPYEAIFDIGWWRGFMRTGVKLRTWLMRRCATNELR